MYGESGLEYRLSKFKCYVKLWFKNPLRHIIGTPIVRHFLKRLTDKCPECGMSIVERKALEAVGEEAEQACDKFRNLERAFNALQFLMKTITEQGVFDPLLDIPLARGIMVNIPFSFSRTAQSIVKGIADFGMKIPLTVGAPFTIFWEFTERCNLNCAYCYARDRTYEELTTEECLKAIDQFADAGVVSVTFSGGEPLLRKDFFEVAGHARENGLVVFLASNGTLINRDTAKRLREIGVEYVEITVDSHEREVHDAFRGAGSFDKAVKAIGYCVEEGIPVVTLATTITAKNKAVVGVLDLAKSLGVHQVVFTDYVPVRRAAENMDFFMNPYERDEAIREVLKQKENYPCFRRVVVLQAPDVAAKYWTSGGRGTRQIGFLEVDERRKSRLLNYYGGCQAGRWQLAMTPNGDIYPCILLPLKLGNIKAGSSMDIWKNSPILADLRDRGNWKGRCGICEHKIICGGSRCRALALFDDYLAPDPACTLNVDLYNQLMAEHRR